MIEQHPAKICKADFRKTQIADNGIELISFDKNEYQKENNVFNTSFLHLFEEVVIKPNGNLVHTFSEDKTIVLIPIVGAMDFELNENKGFVHLNQIQFLQLEEGQKLRLTNPYEEDSISYLIAVLKNSSINSKTLDFEYKPNQLELLFNTDELSVSSGMFSSRTEANYLLKTLKNSVFAFVVNGAFEFQNRLLEARDSLTIWDIKEIELEALTDYSILFIFEIKN